MVKQWEEECLQIQREKARCLRRRGLRRRIYACLSICVLAYLGLAGWWLHRSGELARMQDAAEQRFAGWVVHSGLTVREVSVQGTKQLTADAIIQQAALPADAFILTLSLETVQARLLKHPQIAQARLVRRLPDQLMIDIAEREPAAIWQHNEEERWLDRDGVRLDAAWVTPEAGRRYPVITGDGADEALASLWPLLETSPALTDKLRAAQWVGARRWNLWFEGAPMVMLPMDEAADALRELAAWQAEHDVFSRAVETIDLRSPGKALVQLSNDIQEPAVRPLLAEEI